MKLHKIKSFAKINIALNVVGKNKYLHRIESLVSFLDLTDLIKIQQIKKENHEINFKGAFSKKINANNTISKLIKILEKEKLLKDKKFKIEVVKNIPSEAGLGGGSMNAASVINFFIKKKIIRTNYKKISKICKQIGSDVILGLHSTSLVLDSKGKISVIAKNKKINVLLVKPNFGCSTKKIYAGIRKFSKINLDKFNSKMFNLKKLKMYNNDLEPIAFKNYPKLNMIKNFLYSNSNPEFVRMTGSGSTIVGYFLTKKDCQTAKRQIKKKFKNYWCIIAKTI